MAQQEDKPEWAALGLSLAKGRLPESAKRTTIAHDLVARHLAEHPETKEAYLAYRAGLLSEENGGVGYFKVLDLACAYYQAEHPITL